MAMILKFRNKLYFKKYREFFLKTEKLSEYN